MVARTRSTASSPWGTRRDVRDTDQDFLIPAGVIEGVSAVDKFGRNDDIDGAFEDLWAEGGTHVAPTVGQDHSIVSTSTLDDLGSTGAEQVTVEGLSDEGIRQDEIVTLDGQTPVTLALSYSFINRAYVSDSGSGNKNAGIIRIKAVDDDTVQAHIAIGKSKTLKCIYKTPVDAELYITQYHATMFKDIGTETVGNVELVFINGTETVEDNIGLQKSGSSLTPRVYKPYKRVPAGTIVKLRCETSAADTGVAGAFDGYLVDLI